MKETVINPKDEYRKGYLKAVKLIENYNSIEKDVKIDGVIRMLYEHIFEEMYNNVR